MAEAVDIADHDVTYQADIKLAGVIDRLSIPTVAEMAYHLAGDF
jgi:acyl-CoA synthetase (NDP forming)